MFKKLEHIATVGRDTDEASKFYRYQIGVPLIPSEVIEAANVRLTHLDLGNLHLQLVQSPTEDHQLREHLTEHGEGMHPLCFRLTMYPAQWRHLLIRQQPGACCGK